MITVEYVPSLTSAEEESHALFNDAVDRGILFGPSFMGESEESKRAMKRFAADIWAAAFARAEQVLAATE